VLAQIVLTPESLPRLEKLGDAYQRIRYHSLRFTVEPLLSTAVSGGYTCGFIKDAADPVRDDSTSELLASGGVARKFWESAVISVGQLPDLYYTNPGEGTPEYRWASPGSFVIIVDAPASSAGAVKIYLDWKVTLTEPTVQGTHDNAPGVVEALQSAYTLDQNYGIYDDDGKQLKTEDLFGVKLPIGSVINMPSIRYYSQAQSATAPGYLVGYFRFQVDQDDRPWPMTPDMQPVKDKALGKTVQIEKGERFVVTEPRASEDFLAMRPPWFHSRRACSTEYHSGAVSGKTRSHLPSKYNLLTPRSKLYWTNSRDRVKRMLLKAQSCPSLESLTASLRNLLEKLKVPTELGAVEEQEMWELVHLWRLERRNSPLRIIRCGLT